LGDQASGLSKPNTLAKFYPQITRKINYISSSPAPRRVKLGLIGGTLNRNRAGMLIDKKIESLI
jgi:hypothetical protein